MFADMDQYGQDESSELESDSGDENFLVDVVGPEEGDSLSRVSNVRSVSPILLKYFLDEGAA